MKKYAGVCLLVLVSIGTVTWASNASGGKALLRSPEVGRASKERVSYTRLPLSFEVNEGQVNSRAKYLARGQGFTFFLTQDDALLQLEKPGSAAENASPPLSKFGHLSPTATPFRQWLASTSLPSTSHRAGGFNSDPRYSSNSQTSEFIGLRLLGASRNTKITGEDQLPGYSNYFLGNNPRDWHTDIPNYARVHYHQVYPGVDLMYYGRQGQLENDFVLAPGTDPRVIRLGVEGAEAVHVDRAGDLVLEVSGGKVYLRRPQAYQGHGAERREVSARYVLGAGNQVGFALGSYDRHQQLVIDPVLAYSTYLGGTGGDIGYGIAVDSSGNAYVTGTTASLNFPTTSAGQTTSGGGGDAFVTKFNPSGSALIYSVYLGGSGNDTATGIAIDSSGDAYIVGYTSSSNFPTTTGAFQLNNAGSGDAFLTKLAPTGSSLVYSTYLGGSGVDYGYAVAVDTSGDAFVTGSTESTDFPTLSPLQVGNDGFSDAFLTEFNPLGTDLLYSTYLGGTGGDVGYAIVLDSSGKPYIAGYTTSSDFPTQAALQPSLAGTSNAFITEIDPETSSLVFSTYLGGSGSDVAYSLALDSSDDIYVAGSSSSNDFPVTSGAYQTANHGQGDAFVAKLAPGATHLVYSTLLGGTGTDQARAIALDSSGDAFVTGFTESSNFPLADALQRILGISGASTCGPTVCADAFVSDFGPSGNLIYSTYLGGSATDSGEAIAVDTAGAAYVTGNTNSANFPVIAGAPQSTYAGFSPSPNVFVAKVGPQDAPAVALTPQKINFGNQALNTPSSAQTVTLINAGSAPLGINKITATGAFSQTNNCGTVVSAGGGTCTIQVTFTPTQTGFVTDQISISDTAQGSPQTITVSGTGITSAGTLGLSPATLSFPAQTVGSTSLAQSVQLVNTGSTPVNLTSISTTGDFSQTNTCGNLPDVLNVGAACTISVTFTPTASGSRTGTLTVQDDATNGPQSVALSGTGNPVFSLSANMRSAVLLIGTKSTTFTITASAPSSFTDNIVLSCSTGTCSFNPPSITPGQSSTLTVTGLSATSSNPTNFAVTGTTVNQTSTVTLAIFFADFTVSASPPVASVTAGQSATYKVTLTPTNGFNQVVLLSCTNLPQDTTCTFTPPSLALNGTTASTVNLSVNTTAESTSSLGPRPPGAPPPGAHPQFKWWAYLAALTLICITAATLLQRRMRGQQSLRLRAAFAVLATTVLLAVFVAACNNYYSGPNTSPAVTGTPANTYTITVVGALGSDNSIKRTTNINLAVAP